MKTFNKVLLFIPFFFISLSAYSAVSFKEIYGKWRLMYKNNYGYEFHFQTNYRAFFILYCSTNALIFKGIYSIDKDTLTININEMKNEENIRKIDFQNRFVKASSSYFVFSIKLTGQEGKKILVLKPEKAIIDGNQSDGYFESEIGLKRF